MNEKIKRGPFTVLSSKKVYKNPWISVREDAVIRPGGNEGIFGVVTQGGGSSVIPLDDEGNIYLSREYRYAIGEYSLEAFSGGLEGGESYLEGAKRELKEELGATATEWTDLGIIIPYTAIMNSPDAMFLAKGLTMGQSNLEEGEEMEIVQMPCSEAVEMVMESKITHGATCVAILKVARLLEK